MKRTMESGKVKKAPESEREHAILCCKKVINWLDNNQGAKKGEFEYQQRELEKVCTSILEKPNPDVAGEAEGMSEGLGIPSNAGMAGVETRGNFKGFGE